MSLLFSLHILFQQGLVLLKFFFKFFFSAELVYSSGRGPPPMRRCCAPLGVLLAASTTQSLSFTAQSRLSRVHPARRTAPPTLGAIALLAEQLEVVRSIRPADDSAEVQFKLWENAGLNPTYKVSGSISGEPSYTRLFSHADWREYSGTEPLEREPVTCLL